MKIDGTGALVATASDTVKSEHFAGDISADDILWLELLPSKNLFRGQIEADACSFSLEVWQPPSNVDVAIFRYWWVWYSSNADTTKYQNNLNGEHAKVEIWNRQYSNTVHDAALLRYWLIRDAAGGWHGFVNVRSRDAALFGRIALPANATWLGIHTEPAAGATKFRSRMNEWSP